MNLNELGSVKDETKAKIKIMPGEAPTFTSSNAA